ncbi:MAG TPA: phage capsid protein [Alphaproteobacteria bacterium]|nr:phage capsid protein [Alphaproteobacteria bacterium]
MSNQVTTAFVRQYRDNVSMLAQQKGSKLRRSLMIETSQNGEKAYFDQIAATAAQRTTSRHADSPLMNTPHDRRQVTLVDVEWGDLIDNRDRIRLLIDPTSAYSMNAAWAVGREIDDIIIEKFFADAKTGKDGDSTTSFPASQTIEKDISGTANGLTVEKLREARKLLLSNDVDLEMEGAAYIGVTSAQLDNLLGTTEVTSADYNGVKALVKGEINTFMGFTFIQCERFATKQEGGNTIRRCPVWVPSGMGLAIGAEPRARISERADKRYSTYVYWSGSFGATRLEEEKVIEVECKE